MTPSNPPNLLGSLAYAWRSPWIQIICYLCLFVVIFKTASLISSVIVDFCIAFLLAYLFNPMLNWLQYSRLKLRRSIGVLLVLIALFGMIVLMVILVTTISSELVILIQKLPKQIDNLDRVFAGFVQFLSDKGVQNLDQIQADISSAFQGYINDVGKNIIPLLQNTFSSTTALLEGLASIGGYLARFVLIILMSIYLMIDYDRVNKSIMNTFPYHWHGIIKEVVELLNKAVGGYVRGQLIIATFIGVVVWIGLSLVGIPSAAAIGFLAGAFNIVPYLGPIIGATPALLLALTLPAASIKMLLVVIVFVVANQVEGQLLSPMVLSKTTDLHPLSVLLSILIGVSVFGMAGALLAVPLVALGKLALHKYYYNSHFYLQKKPSDIIEEMEGQHSYLPEKTSN